MARIAVAGENDDLVASLLQADGGIDDKPFGPTDAQVGVQEDYCLAVVLGLVRHMERDRLGRTVIAWLDKGADGEVGGIGRVGMGGDRDAA